MKKYKDFFKSITIVLITQAIIYFLIKLIISNYITINSVLTIPLIKWFVYFYDSWYPFIFFASFIIYKHNKENYYKLIFTLIIASLLAHITFIVFPTMVERPDINISSFTDLILYITYKSDTPAVNCLPSVHCLYCFIIIFYILIIKSINLKYKVPIILYLILIILSTLFIQQHIVEDVILSFIYTIISIILVYIFYGSIRKTLNFLFN